MRESDTPSVLSPGTFSTLAPVTTEPTELLVAPGLARTLEKKSSAVAFALHGNPFTFTSATCERAGVGRVRVCTAVGVAHCVCVRTWGHMACGGSMRARAQIRQALVLWCSGE